MNLYEFEVINCHWMATNFDSRHQVARGAWQDAARALRLEHTSKYRCEVWFALFEHMQLVIPHQSEVIQSDSKWHRAGTRWNKFYIFAPLLKVRVQLPKLPAREEDLGSKDDCGTNGWKNSKSHLWFIDIHCTCTCTYDVSSLTVCLTFKHFHSLECATWSEPRFSRGRFLFDFRNQLYISIPSQSRKLCGGTMVVFEIANLRNTTIMSSPFQ